MFIEENAADMGPYFSWALGGRTHRHAPEPGLLLDELTATGESKKLGLVAEVGEQVGEGCEVADRCIDTPSCAVASREVDVSGSTVWQACSAATPDSRALAGGREEVVGVKQRWGRTAAGRRHSP
jgi:hypothetical protein